MLVLCLNELTKSTTMDVCIKCINVYTENTDSRERIETWPYLVRKGYYKKLRMLLDSMKHSEVTLKLINRPLHVLHLVTTQKGAETIVAEFTKQFLCTAVTIPVKDILIPCLKSRKFPFDHLLQYLYEELTVRNDNNYLLYCVLALEPPNFGNILKNIFFLKNVFS